MKNTATIRPADLRGLKSFRDEYPESKAIFLYRGRERILREGIICLPCGDFLRQLLPDKTIDDTCMPSAPSHRSNKMGQGPPGRLSRPQ